MQHIETVLILILFLLNDAEVLSPTNANAGVMLRNKSNKYKGLVNKDLKLLKQKISADHISSNNNYLYYNSSLRRTIKRLSRDSICNVITLISNKYKILYAEVKREIRE
ncbi:hypothetical protein HBI15_158150 [Parastagonospora nodorum]|nr:hypothetical protein HBI15_158150 [Parastagonospora nodorum]